MPARGKWPRGKRKATFGKPAQKSDPEVGDLVGKIVHIPATEYGISVPGMFYRARVVKKDPKHKSSVIVSFYEDDGSHNWLPAMEVRRWLMEAGHLEATTNSHSDDYAAQTLLHIKNEKLRRMPDKAPAGNQLCDTSQAGCHSDADNKYGAADVEANAEGGMLKMKDGRVAIQDLQCGRHRCVLAEGQAGSIGTDWVHLNDEGAATVQAVAADGKGDVEMDL